LENRFKIVEPLNIGFVIKLSPFVKDILKSTIVSGTSIVSAILITRVIARNLGVEGFTVFNLAKRVMATIAPFSICCMDVAIPRFIAITRRNEEKNSYLVAGVVWGIFPGVIVAIIGLFLSEWFARLIFQDSKYQTVFIVTLFSLLGYSIYVVVLAIHQGNLDVSKANLTQLLIGTLTPLLFVFLYPLSQKPELYVGLTGIVYIIAIIPLGALLINALQQINYKDLKQALAQIGAYGVIRVPGTIAYQSLFLLGPYLSALFLSLEETGYFIAAQSLLRVIEGGVIAFGLVALPKTASLIKEGRQQFLSERIKDIISLTLSFGLYTGLHVAVWGDWLIIAWLGQEYARAGVLTRIMISGLIPYLTYVTLRSVIDAAVEEPINTKNTIIALIVGTTISLAALAIKQEIIGILLGYVSGMITLGWLTVAKVLKLYAIQFVNTGLQKIIAVNVLLLLASLGVRRGLELVENRPHLLLLAVAISEGIFFMALILCLDKLGVTAIQEMKKRIIG
jgi:O-antigen/teichoic acid export membrane protein